MLESEGETKTLQWVSFTEFKERTIREKIWEKIETDEEKNTRTRESSKNLKVDEEEAPDIQARDATTVAPGWNAPTIASVLEGETGVRVERDERKPCLRKPWREVKNQFRAFRFGKRNWG